MSVKRRSNGSWEVRYRDPSGSHRSKSFRTQALAKRYENSVIDAMQKGSFSAPINNKITMDELFAMYMESKRNFKPKTKADLNSIWNYLISPSFAKSPVSSVTHEKVHKWATSCVLGESAITSDSRMNKALGYLSRIFDFGLDLGYINKNPMLKSTGKSIRIEVSKSDNTPKANALTLEQLLRLSKECGEFEDMVILLGVCGLRWAEVVGLRASDFSDEGRKITLSRTLSEVAGKFTDQSTKTGKPRTIYVPSYLAKRIWYGVKQLEPDDLVFSNSAGRPLGNSNFRRRVFDPAIKAAGIPRVTIHHLRHTAASLAISSGANSKVISRLLGHADASMTLRVYSHAFEDDLVKLADEMSLLLEDSGRGNLKRVV
jgi:integrase